MLSSKEMLEAKIKTTSIAIKIPAAVHNSLLKKAEKENTTLTEIINQAFSSYLQNDDFVIDIEVQQDFKERLANYLDEIKDIANLVVPMLKSNAANLAQAKKGSKAYEFSYNHIKDLINALYGDDFSAVARRKITQLLLFNEAQFTKLINEAL